MRLTTPSDGISNLSARTLAHVTAGGSSLMRDTANNKLTVRTMRRAQLSCRFTSLRTPERSLGEEPGDRFADVRNALAVRSALEFVDGGPFGLTQSQTGDIASGVENEVGDRTGRLKPRL